MGWLHQLFFKGNVEPSWYREAGRISARFTFRGAIAARVRGRSGSYAVFGSVKALDCTCSARRMPCPHVVAVGQEWAETPERFVELEQRLGLGADEMQLGEAMERLVLTNPMAIFEALEKGSLGSLVDSMRPLAQVANGR